MAKSAKNCGATQCWSRNGQTLCIFVLIFLRKVSNNTQKRANKYIIRLLIYIYFFTIFLKYLFQWWVLTFDLFVTWEVCGTYYFREFFLQPHHVLLLLETHTVLSETCIEFIGILLSIQCFVSYSSATGNVVIKFYDWPGALLVCQLAYIALDDSHSVERAIISISSLQIYLHDICSHIFTLVTLSAFKHIINIVLKTCDEIITIHLTLFLTTRPSTIERMRDWQQFHRFTWRYGIKHTNFRDVLHHDRAWFHQLNSNSRDHCTKRAFRR